MPERTTIAEILTHVFATLEQGIPPQPQSGVTLLQAWSSTLGGAGRNALDVVASIGQVCSILIKLEAQVRDSKKLKDFQKNAAIQTISGFKILFAVQRFHEPAIGFRAQCHEHQRGNLGLIGHSLEPEFSEPRLEKPDADDLAAAIVEVKNLLSDSDISLDLRLSLMRHVDAMTWWLAHPEMASMQDLFETIGSAMVIAKQIADRDPERESAEPTASKSILERVLVVGTKFGNMMGLTVRGIEAADQVGGQVSRLLEAFTPP